MPSKWVASDFNKSVAMYTDFENEIRAINKLTNTPTPVTT